MGKVATSLFTVMAAVVAITFPTYLFTSVSGPYQLLSRWQQHVGKAAPLRTSDVPPTPQVRILMSDPLVVHIENFLLPEECDYLLNLSCVSVRATIASRY